MHPIVKQTQSTSILTERCEDLTEKGKCPFNDQELTQILTDNIIGQPTDIEELAEHATRMQICGYFSARRAQAEADIIVTPY